MAEIKMFIVRKNVFGSFLSVKGMRMNRYIA